MTTATLAVETTDGWGRTNGRGRGRYALLGALLLVGAALRFYGLAFGLPHDLARPDEEKIIRAALVVAGGDLNPHLFLYPSLYVYALALGYWCVFSAAGGAVQAAAYAAGAVSDPSLLHLVARALSAVAGVATIGVVWAASRELWGTRAAAVAAFFLSVAYLHVRDSHFGTTDVPATLAACCAFWVAARAATRGTTMGRAAAAGLLCGLAASTKYNLVLVVAPALFAVAGRPLLELRRPRRGEAAGAALLLACAAVAFVAATPYALLARTEFLAQFAEQRRIFAGLQNGSIIGPARAVFGGERGWIHYATFTLPYGVGLPLLAASGAGAAWLAARRPRQALLLLSFPFAYYLSMGLGQLVYARNMVPIVPFVAMAAAVSVDRLSSLLGRFVAGRRPGGRPLLAAGATIVLAGALAGPTVGESIAFDRLMRRADTRVLGSRWLEAHVPAGAAIYQTGAFYGHLQPQPAERFERAAFNERRVAFGGRNGLLEPDVIVRLDSPLSVYSPVPAALDDVLRRDYALTQVFHARRTGAERQGVYDEQDAWYAPFARVDSVDRPGPDVSIYLRRAAGVAGEPPARGK